MILVSNFRKRGKATHGILDKLLEFGNKIFLQGGQEFWTKVDEGAKKDRNLGGCHIWKTPLVSFRHSSPKFTAKAH